jgi:hypothetical protein
MAFTLIPCVLLSALPAAAQQMARTDSPMRPQFMESYGKLPLSFEANQGQTDPRVKFLSRGPGYSLFLTEDSAVLSLRGQMPTAAVLKMKLAGANAHARVTGAEALPGKSNYFVGKDPKQWRTNLPTYGAVKYSDVYPGIDLVYHGNQRLLEYDFVVAPGADPRLIDLRFRSAKKLRVNSEGALVIGLGASEVIEHAPVVYQEIGGVRKTFAGRYVMRGRGRVGFSVAEYDRSRALVIDPTLVYSTYLGGSGSRYTGDQLNAIAVDGSGNAYVTGSTTSSDYPTTPGAFQPTLQGDVNVFVTKLNATGSALVYSTYLGGAGGYGIAVDPSGNAYVTGIAGPDFPTTPGAFQTTFGGVEDAFVTKLNATGSALVYSTYLGGDRQDQGDAIAIDASGNAYIAGGAGANFPTTPGAFQTAFRGGNLYETNAFVSKLNTTGSALIYSTYLGGSGGLSGGGGDLAWGIAVDAAGNAYVVGVTNSSNFPTTSGAFQTTFGGPSNGTDAFVSKLNATGSDLDYSTYLGGVAGGYGIAVDIAGHAYVVGYTQSNFPTTSGAFQTTYGGPNADAFVSKLNATGSALDYSTYLGGSNGDWGSGIAIDASGNAYVTGYTYSSDFPTTPGAFQNNERSPGGAFVTELNPGGSALLYSTYLGGTGTFSYGIAVDTSGNAYVIGSPGTFFPSIFFPTTPGAFQATPRGGFVSKLSPGPWPTTTAVLNGPAGSNGWYVGPVTVTLSATAGSTPISTYYSVDGEPYVGYGASFEISGDGVHQLLFYSVDAKGDQETPHGQSVKIDAAPPVTRVATLPAAAASPNFSVQWSGTDATSGLSSYTIYVSDNGGPFTLWLSQTTAWFVGHLTHSYGFYSIGRDNAGNVEIKTVADATTYVPQMEGDVNGDGYINCIDIDLVKASFGTRTGQPGFNPAADVNKDGVVNVLDLAIVSQKLIPGTKCP